MTSSTEPQTAPYYFISYSRQEVTFVDSFARELEKHGIRTWVDFRNLVPGHKWQKQLDDGVHNSDAILLVVSTASMKSKPVMDELDKSIKAGRRIVMIIFEPCKIDSRLKEREWIDFSDDFDAGVGQLKLLLAQPEGKMTSSPPEKYVRKKTKLPCFVYLIFSLPLLLIYSGLRFIFGASYLPKGVKRFFFLGILTILLSFFALTLGTSTNEEGMGNIIANLWVAALPFVYIPAAWNFLQFPVRVRYRTHNAEKLRNSIFGLFAITLLPLLTSLGAVVGINGLNADATAIVFSLLALPGCYYLYRVLTSDAFYRWAGPAGVLVGPTRPDLSPHLNEDQGDTKVAIEAAPQDQAYAMELKDSIVKAGFKYTDDLQEANIVLTLLSVYQNQSKCDPENKYVVPILLQSFSDIDDGEKNEFAQVQWIDLRFGKASMDAVANLLDEPNDLLRVLGIIPVRTPILPNGVNHLISLISFVLTYSAIFVFFQIFGHLTPDSTTGVTVGLTLVDVVGMIFVVGLYLLRKYIIKRRFWLMKNRVKRFYQSAKSDPIMSKLAPRLEERMLFFDLEKKLNEKMGRVVLPYPLVIGFAVLLAALATGAYWTFIIAAIPAWLIPLLMLLKPLRLWLPTRTK